jgi:hypothetical protein
MVTMDKYKTKSVIIGRKKRKDKTRDDHPCFITLFSVNDPHKSGEVPDKILDYENIHKLVIKGCDINYLLAGNDLVINDLEYIEVEVDGPHIYINGKQKK